jgi:hypothetical protein
MSSEQAWEEIVDLARTIDRGVADHQGVDHAEVLRLAKAVVAFQRRITSRSFSPPETDSSTGSDPE